VNGSDGPLWNTAALAVTLDQVGFPPPAERLAALHNASYPP